MSPSASDARSCRPASPGPPIKFKRFSAERDHARSCTGPSLPCLARVQQRGELGGGNRAVGVRAQFGELRPVDVAVKAHADPAPVTDVGRAEEPVRRRADEGFLRAGQARAPEVRKVIAVMAVGPQLREGLLVAYEPC